MTNNSNIYDIDGEIIRKIDDNHQWTVEEVKNKIEYYRNKLKDLAEDDKKAVLYATYMRNLSNYLLVLYSKMTPDQLNAEINAAKALTTNEQVKKAMEELQDSLNEEEKEKEEPKETVMDEYVDFEEVTNGCTA
jgi:gas vesicle protein